MRKILIISTVGLIYDGITNVILSYLQAMDLSNMEIYIGATINVVPEIRSKLEKMGCQIIELPSRRDKPLKYMFELVKMIRINKIQVIHAHGNSGTLAIEMVAAWLGGCRKRIAHSHNTQCDKVRADKLLRPIFNMFYTDALACGGAAGKWLFGNKKFTVLQNGRNIDEFSYNENVRISMRNQYGLKQEIVIGHVGGFFKQKNHSFLISIFKEIMKKEPSAHLFLIGDGPLKNEIIKNVEEFDNSIEFIGKTDRVADYLQMMDVMVLPSLFEGLPLVAIEWQINGLPCILSDNVTKACAFAENIVFMSLDNSPEQWAEKILESARNSKREKSSERAKDAARQAGFDIRDGASNLYKIYME